MTRNNASINQCDPAMVYTVIAGIPLGKVDSYGSIAEKAGYPGRARWVGQLLAKLPADSKLPWHRVVNNKGMITCPRADLASKKLKIEGVAVAAGRIDMRRYRC